VIAIIAEDNLSPDVRAKARQYLSGAPLDTAAMFADEVRAVQRQSCPPQEITSKWHFVDIPYKDNFYDEARDCPKGECVIQAIERVKAKIRDGNASFYERANALKLLVHFVGDLHQPFHTIDNNDQGGNAVNVTFFGEPWTLHALWDDGLILRTGRPAEYYAVYLEHEVLPKLPNSDLTNTDPVAWANAAHKLAQDAYVDSKNCSALGEDYFNKYIIVVQNQLALAGAHLAAELTEVLKDSPPLTPFRACSDSPPLITGCPQSCPPPSSQCPIPELMHGGATENQLAPRQSLDFRSDN
jgi:hypothetical protein